MKTTLKIILAFLILGSGIGFLIFFEFYVTDKVDTVEVVRAKETIGFKEKITADNIEIANVKRGSEVENAIPTTSYKSLIGKYASIKIEKGAQLYSDLVDTYNLVPDTTKGEFVAPVPKEWLFAVPGSLRRTYVADIYAIGDEDQKMKKALIAAAEEQEGKKQSKDAVITSDVKPNTEPILSSVRVASVKDNGNKEVKESQETREATGQVSALEIIATEEMLDTISEAVNDGYKLYVVYKFERSDNVTTAGTLEKATQSETTEIESNAKDETVVEEKNDDKVNVEDEVVEEAAPAKDKKEEEKDEKPEAK